MTFSALFRNFRASFEHEHDDEHEHDPLGTVVTVWRLGLAKAIVLLLTHHSHSNDLLESVEIPVIVQQLEIPLDTRSCNDHVNSSVNGYAFGTKGAIIPRSLKTHG